MITTSNGAQMIHKKCKTKMTTIFLEDRVGELTYCPKCVSPMQIKEILKKFKVYETTGIIT